MDETTTTTTATAQPPSPVALTGSAPPSALVQKVPPRGPLATSKDLVISAVMLSVAVVAITVAFAFGMIPAMFNAKLLSAWISWPLAVVGAIVVLVGIGRLAAQVSTLDEEVDYKFQEPERSKRLYGIYLVGVGFALLVQTLACSMVFIGISLSVADQRAAAIQQTQAGGAGTSAGTAVAPPSSPQKLIAAFDSLFGKDAGEALSIAGLFVLSMMVASLGAMFFFANALWQKMDAPERDPFDRRVFWGGLWFRIGEAILFNLVFFLVIRSYAPDRVLLLPLVSLLVGMFLKTGESLVSGIATRVFAAIQALVPADGGKKPTKLLTFKIGGLDPNATPVATKQRVDELIAVLDGLSGVAHAEADTQAQTARLEYDPSTVTIDDLKKKVQLKGLQMNELAS